MPGLLSWYFFVWSSFIFIAFQSVYHSAIIQLQHMRVLELLICTHWLVNRVKELDIYVHGLVNCVQKFITCAVCIQIR